MAQGPDEENGESYLVKYNSARSELKVGPRHNSLICSVSLGTMVHEEYFPWLQTEMTSRTSWTLPLDILNVDRDAPVVINPDETINDPSMECFVKVEFQDCTSENAVYIHIQGLREKVNISRLASLYDKLKAYFSNWNSMELGTLLYRNKPSNYFEDIRRCGDGIMRTYLKDKNGDPNNPLNNRLKGLFFCATLCRGDLPDMSPFGTERFQAPIQSLLENLGEWNIYFADFYCMERTSGLHYVTLVLCKRDSESDQFCSKNLYTLPEENPVFVINDTGDEFKVCVGQKAWVEIFYTEDINITEMIAKHKAQMTEVPLTGNIMSKGGIRKKKTCKWCNVESKQWMPADKQ